MLFAELLSPARNSDLVYNLGSNALQEEFKERSFNVLINGQELLTHISNMEALEPLHAITTKHVVNLNNNEGITLDFKALKGETILNGIQIKKIF